MLKGTTNPEAREPENREPVFIISKELVKGMDIVAAVIRPKGLRPLVLSSTSGKIQTTNCNFSDIA